MGGWAIAVHGGAGVDPNLPLERQEEAKQLLTRVLNLGISALRSNLSAIDVVELVVYVLFYLVPTPIMSCPVLSLFFYHYYSFITITTTMTAIFVTVIIVSLF
jgi:hypothetical protein